MPDWLKELKERVSLPWYVPGGVAGVWYFGKSARIWQVFPQFCAAKNHEKKSENINMKMGPKSTIIMKITRDFWDMTFFVTDI